MLQLSYKWELQMVSEPLKVILSNTDHTVEDFEVSKYTWAGNYILILIFF